MPTKTSPKVPPELEDFAEQIGSFIEYWGFKKIHGQVWTHIYLAKTPIDATTLVKRLKVSKALISLVIKDLVEYNVIKVAGKGSRRKILFQANPDLTEVICSVLRMRERKMLSQIMSAHKNFKKISGEDKKSLDINEEKVQQLGQLIEDAENMLDSLISYDLEIKLAGESESPSEA